MHALSYTLYSIYVDCGQHTYIIINLFPTASFSFSCAFLYSLVRTSSLCSQNPACSTMPTSICPILFIHSACPVLYTLGLYALPACLYASIYVPTPYPLPICTSTYTLPSALAVSVYILQINIHVFIQLLLHSAPNPSAVSFNHSHKSSLSYLP